MDTPLISIRVPATSANLGAGFDTLGMALSLYNVFKVTELLPEGQFACDAVGEGARELGDAKDNKLATYHLNSFADLCGITD